MNMMSVMASSPFSPLGFLHFLEDENSSLFGKGLDRGQISRFMGHKMHHEEVDAPLPCLLRSLKRPLRRHQKISHLSLTRVSKDMGNAEVCIPCGCPWIPCDMGQFDCDT